MYLHSETESLDKPVTRRAFLFASPPALAYFVLSGRHEEVWPVALAWAFDGPDHVELLRPGIELSISDRRLHRYVKHRDLALGCLPPDFPETWLRQLHRGQATVCLDRVFRNAAGRLCLRARWRQRP